MELINDKPVLTVKQLNTYIKSLIESDKTLISFYLRGEISNFTNHYKSGHYYLTVKDEESAVRAVMFKFNASKLKFDLYDGMKILALGRASVFERDGQYQFYIDNIIPEGDGALAVAFEQLKAKLQKEGFFSEEHKIRIPKIPAKIGVVTSPTGAAIRDIITVLKRRYPIADVILYPVLVQGSGAPPQIVEAIQYFNKSNWVDVIIVGRGGGSLEDLWAFNDENVAKSIYNSEIPIISAVGHEIDFTISDFVADLRAPTPSAAAEVCCPDSGELSEQFSNLKQRFQIFLEREFKSKKDFLDSLKNNAFLKNPMRYVDEKKLIVDYSISKLSSLGQLTIQNKKSTFIPLVAKLKTLNPLSVLSRGYSVAVGNDGNAISSVKSVKKGDIIDLNVSDGKIHCIVNGKTTLKGVKNK